jgi:hypothetical protein
MTFRLCVTRRALAALYVAAACTLVCGCSATTFPTVLADPPGPNDPTLSPDQVKQAMDGLISDRNHLCAVAVADQSPGSSPQGCGATGTTANAGAAAKP